MSKSLTCLIVSGVVSVAACGGDATSPDDEPIVELTESDAQFVVDLIDATTAGLLDDFFDSDDGNPENAPALTHEPIVWTRTFERSRPCHDGGTLTITGTSESSWDAGAVTLDVASSGTKARVDCAHVRDDATLITLNGTADWTHERHYLDHAPTGTWVTTYIGEFDWTRGTGGSGNCSYELTRTVDTAANTRTLIGTSCGNPVDRSGTWRP